MVSDVGTSIASSKVALPAEAKRQPRQPKTLTRAQLAERIANGETLVLHRRKIYKLDKWLSRHPGGELAILHFVGRDATDEIEAYHSEDTISRLMSRYVIGHLDEADWHNYRPLVPPVQLGYRKGRLDHPHAQVAMWRHRNTPSTSAVSSDRDSQEPELSSDSTDEALVEGMLSDTSEQTRPSRSSPSESRRKSAVKPAAPSTLIVERPNGFPLPVDLLEPPPVPESVDPIREHQISEAYKKLHQQVKDAGLYTLKPVGYAREVARYLLLGSIAFALWSCGQSQLRLEQSATSAASSASSAWSFSASTTSFLLSSFFLGLFWHQLTFSAHDSGHSGITHSWQWDRIIGTTIADFIGGLSIGWWCDNHDVHHLVTNHPEHDPDIQHMPFFAISPQFVLAGQTTIINANDSNDASAKPLGLWSSYYRRVLEFDAPSRFLLKHQHKLYYIVMAFGRFNLYANSYGFLATKARRDRWWALELVGLATFWTWYGYGLLGSLPSWPVRIGYLLISHIVTSPLHVQIVLSHFAQSCDDLGLSESFASRQIRTTMDVDCPTWLDFVHGGLHMQVSHHLFPRVPRHNLREVRDRFVVPFAKKWGLEYHEYSFTKGNGRVLATLKRVADQVHILGKVAQAQAKGELQH
ncbi:Fatty acid desaturase, type 1 [Kalmanozyma brasiliensis GHG001]|uniref:Delta 8-(E)-sphingolipid desaturase n=1 Tax=Kalmanozyma brasiliensis (strain GHG001) TaxID=1365824 RepID=V5EV02_KALBG|nr:Fatty acid desaturase, type 1 [Kalmanozyma brasiliensis GHG001]EST06004.1 Fatty acid desaturase, type 1 [Kalmanozyma brasiliensis GHG001]